ncbi:MAG TPA: FtsQ-type POTRA domain-containing protein [Actinomycetota bacterium]|nr:FtsQ-type POTRA domain-containing protein [Actinomycetota bacterium]
MKLAKVLVLLLAGALLYQGAQAVMRSRSLQLDQFEVEGNTESRISTETVVEATDVQIGDHLLAVSTEQVAARLEKLPWVADAKVERILPSTLRISIDEREPSFVLQTGQGSFLADARGLVLQEGSGELVNVLELPIRPLGPGTLITTPEFTHAARILRSLPPQIRSTVSAIRAPSIDQIQIETAGGPVIFYGAAEQIEEKNFAAQTLFERTKSATERVAVIDVRVPSRPVTRPR